MDNVKAEARRKAAQANFDYRLWQGENLPEYKLLSRLYGAGFTKSEAARALKFIYNQTEKALKEG